MLKLIEKESDVVAVTADFNNQGWPMPTTAWRIYLRWVVGLQEGAWQGRVVGPLLRFGYSPVPDVPQPMEWLGTGNSLVQRRAYDQVGGFSDFFLHRCTMNEDVDLGLRLSSRGRILLCPAARMAHHHAPGGRVSAAVAAEDDLYNRFLVLRRTAGASVIRAMALVLLFYTVETISQFVGCLRRLNFQGFGPQLAGRVRALVRILSSACNLVVL
jgi:GT2 family glycosyltransferase